MLERVIQCAVSGNSKVFKANRTIPGHGAPASAATQLYMCPGSIETGLGKLKTPGFHTESSQLRGDGKMELLLAALTIAAQEK